MTWLEKPTTRSIRCNAELVREARIRRGYTQVELATVAGFTPRLIAKAEAGENLHPDTIEISAEALSLAESLVHPEDFVTFPKEIVRQFVENYALHERQITKHCQHFLADDMTAFVPGDPNIIEFSGQHESIDGFDGFWKMFFGVMERHDKRLIVNSMRLFADGNNIAVLTQEIATHECDKLVTGKILPIGFLFEFERGKLQRFEDHFDASAVQNDILAASSKALLKKQTDGSPN